MRILCAVVSPEQPVRRRVAVGAEWRGGAGPCVLVPPVGGGRPKAVSGGGHDLTSDGRGSSAQAASRSDSEASGSVGSQSQGTTNLTSWRPTLTNPAPSRDGIRFE